MSIRIRRVGLVVPHHGQAQILKTTIRFRVVACGRRFGKTELGKILLTELALRGGRCWWLAPTYATASQVWRELKQVFVTVPGVQRAFYDRLTTPDALYRFARSNLFTDEFGVPEEYVEYGAETARVEGAARPLDDFLNGRLFPEYARDAFLHLAQPLLVIHGLVTERRMESYESLPEVVARPGAEVLALPTGSLPHWERPGVVFERITGFYEEQAALVTVGQG